MSNIYYDFTYKYHKRSAMLFIDPYLLTSNNTCQVVAPIRFRYAMFPRRHMCVPMQQPLGRIGNVGIMGTDSGPIRLPRIY